MNGGLLNPKWTDEEIAYALKVATTRPLGQGIASVARDIAAHLGRTGKSVEQKLNRLLMSPATKERRAAMERARYAKRVQKYHPYETKQIVMYRPTPAMLEARDAKSSAPVRDLTALLCGDPPVGFSALERRA